MKLRSTFAVLCLFFFLNCRGQVYVDLKTGVDAFGYGTMAKPYKTISFGVTTAQFYDETTVYVKPDIYADTTEIFIYKRLNLLPWGSGTVVIDGSSRKPSGSNYLIAVVNTSNVVIDGFTLQNYIGNGYKGIHIISNALNTGISDSIVVSHCKINNIGWKDNNLTDTPGSSSVVANAIVVEGQKPLTNVRLIGNEIFNCAPGWGEAVTFKGDVKNFVVDSNKVHHIANIGMVFFGGDGTAVTATNDQPRDGQVSNNEIYNCMSGIANAAGLYLDGSRNITVYNNRLYDNAVGISVGAEETTTNIVGKHNIYNNIVYRNSVGGAYLGSSNPANTVRGVNFFNNSLTWNSTGLPVNGITHIRAQTISAVAYTLGEVCLFNLTGDTIQYNIFDAFPAKRCMVTMSGGFITGLSSNYNLFNHDETGTMFFSASGSINGYSISGGLYTLSSILSSTGLERNSRFGDPAFTSRSTGLLSLQPWSRALNMGGPYNPAYSGSRDFADLVRVFWTSIDAGAYEYQGHPLAVDDMAQYSRWSVFPNPNNGVCNITTQANFDNFNVVLLDIAGRKILECYSGKVVNNQVIPISFAGVSNGVYLLSITADTESENMKIIVQQ